MYNLLTEGAEAALSGRAASLLPRKAAACKLCGELWTSDIALTMLIVLLCFRRIPHGMQLFLHYLHNKVELDASTHRLDGELPLPETDTQYPLIIH